MRHPCASVAVPSYAPSVPIYQPYTRRDLGRIQQLRRLPAAARQEMEVVARVLPFRASNFVIEELIDWRKAPDDPYFRLMFPVRDMLRPAHYERMAAALKRGSSVEVDAVAKAIRSELNPHPAGQLERNVPVLKDSPLPGMQHKYPETVLFFPTQGQTCHAYCSFCFRWAQFIGDGNLRIAAREGAILADYLRVHPEVSDVLFTGGDPLVMKTQTLATYIDRLLAADIDHLSSIRIGTKALTFWPHRFLTDPDADDLLRLFERVVKAGKHLAFMAHFNHPRAVSHPMVQRAIARIRETGAEIRTQSPLLAHINDDPGIWSEMWREQVKSGCIPYYMFVVRDTGAQHYFGVPLSRAHEIFQGAYQQVSGLARTVRGPSLSTAQGKLQVMGVNEIEGERVFTLQFIQARQPEWVLQPFFARYDPEARWLDELRPAFGEERFFFDQP
ncbi:KamA family radical SAM protein [Thiocystis violacea]|uniref:KamA family radical SAM protein n=1 Tax=Thiocystis violacea TaxID=13725 RepID=UPI0019036281|nr:lysine 2,3-aminomutase [Thiocystis violacea]MBK1717957.1 lysine 2,3-aminomutase [Thiocystis violacea]